MTISVALPTLKEEFLKVYLIVMDDSDILPSCAVNATSNCSYEFHVLFQNVKAYLRRGYARDATLNYKEALQGAAVFLSFH